MPVNILGMIGVAPPAGGATVHVIGGGIDREYVRRFAQVHEAAGFDAVLVGYSSSSAEGFQIAQYAAAHTDQLKFLVAHRPGFVMPTLAARTAATFDNLTDGRLWLHIISGGADGEQHRDGDWLGHDERYQRTDEYLEILRRVWTSEKHSTSRDASTTSEKPSPRCGLLNGRTSRSTLAAPRMPQCASARSIATSMRSSASPARLYAR